jgi:proliferating cell nuclear antigen PCNA
MKVTVSDKCKKDLFLAIFQILKNCSSLICVKFMQEKMHIQGMDKSHVCLFDVNINKTWFNNYDITEEKQICFDANIFCSIISTKGEGLDINIYTEGDDNLNVDLIALEHLKGEFNKYFKIPLAEFEYEELNIPVVDYEAEFSISAKKICEIFSQMIFFGNDINIKCCDDKIDLITNGITGEMLVNIPIDDLTEYSIVEDENVNLTYSLNYINKMCLTNKLSSEIQFYISSNYPMKINYDLGDESSIVFYIAPKIID